MPDQVEVTHAFDAPRELVFQAFADAEHLRRWWGPRGWALRVLRADIRTGGSLHYSQQPAEGGIMWVKFVYREIVVPEKIEYISCFSDEQGRIARAPFDPNWPMETLTTVTFAEDAGKTIVTLRAKPVSPSEAELEAFGSSKDTVREGFGGTLGQLAEYLRGASE